MNSPTKTRGMYESYKWLSAGFTHVLLFLSDTIYWLLTIWINMAGQVTIQCRHLIPVLNAWAALAYGRL